MALLDLSADDWAVLNWQHHIVCEHCGVNESVGLYPALTAYVDQAMNEPLYLCPPCSEEYYDYYKEKWAEARS